MRRARVPSPRLLIAFLSAALVLVAEPGHARQGPEQGVAAAPSIDPSFRADIGRLLEVTGARMDTRGLVSAVTDKLLRALQQSWPHLSQEALVVARETTEAELERAITGPGGLTARLIDVYARHFTHDEVSALLDFYESDLGRKTRDLIPLLIDEGMLAGQEWALTHMARIGTIVETRLKAEGLLR
jgi:hypothetical protein